MSDLHSILMAGGTGLVWGLMLSIPVGPVNMTILNEGARRGFLWAWMIGMGATAMEVTYCFIAFTGFATFFSHGIIKIVMEIASIVFMLYLGIRFLRSKTVHPRITLGVASQKWEGQIKERLHPHSAFMIGYVRVMANLGVFVFWIVLAANFISQGWVTPDWPGKLACVAGVGVGTGLWFSALSWGVSLGHGKLSDRALLKMEHGSGIGLLLLALFYIGKLIWEMSTAAA